jgi:hypothetical protein
VNLLTDTDRQQIENLRVLIHKDLDLLNQIERRRPLGTPLQREQLALEAEQMRESYNRHREEYADLLRNEIPTRFALGEQALMHMVMQRLNSDQLVVTGIALQEVDRDPDAPEFTQLAAEVTAAISTVQQQLVAKNTPAAHQIAQVAHVIQAPTADLKQKLKVSIPLIPFVLSYETELNLTITANLKVAWERLKERFRPL